MMRKLCIAGLCVGMLFGATFAEAKKELSKQDQAKALVEKGLAHAKKVGFEQACKDFVSDTVNFKSGEFYLFAFDYKNTCLAHGASPKMVGKDWTELTDANGKRITENFVKIAKDKGTGWSEYKWANPTTKKVQDKQSYIAKVEGMDDYIGCGFYK